MSVETQIYLNSDPTAPIRNQTFEIMIDNKVVAQVPEGKLLELLQSGQTAIIERTVKRTIKSIFNASMGIKP